MKSNIIISGHGEFEIRRQDGTVVERWEADNTIVNKGKEIVAKLLNGVTSTYFRAIAIGTGVTAVAVGNTTLETESKRALATLSYLADYKAILEHTFTFESGETFDITEAGVLDNSTSGGNLLDRFTFSAKTVDVDTTLYVKITITVA